MYLKQLCVLSIVVDLVGCYIGLPPTQSNIDKSRVYNAPYDQVWSAIIAVVGESNLPITTLEKASGIVAISNATYEPGWANEGTRGSVLGVSDLVTQRVATFNIIAVREDSGQTRVRINSSFKMNVRRGNGSEAFPFTYQWQQAYSNGTLENIIFEGIASRLPLK